MPSIEISESTFASLQALARPFIDTPDDVIRTLLGDAARDLSKANAEAKIGIDIIDFPAGNVPSLKFAAVKSYVVAGVSRDASVYWSTLLADMLRACSERGWSPQALVEAMKTPCTIGHSEAAGYQFVADAGVSFQQLNSDRSFEQIYSLAKLAQVPFEVVWLWGNNAKVSHPGKLGRAWHQ